MVGKRVLKRLELEQERREFLQALFVGIPTEQTCELDRVIIFPEKDKLDQEDNALISPSALVSDKGLDLKTFVDDYIPRIHLSKKNVSDVNTETFEGMNKKLEEMQAEIQRKDEVMKQQRQALEKEKNEKRLKADEKIKSLKVQ